MKRFALGAICMLSWLGAGSCAADEPIGRLFFTPQQRAALDAGRKIAESRPPGAAKRGTRKKQTIRLDGVVTRSDGERTLWINGRAYHGGAPAGVQVIPTPDPASVRVQKRAGGKSVELRVGQPQVTLPQRIDRSKDE